MCATSILAFTQPASHHWHPKCKLEPSWITGRKPASQPSSPFPIHRGTSKDPAHGHPLAPLGVFPIRQMAPQEDHKLLRESQLFTLPCLRVPSAGCRGYPQTGRKQIPSCPLGSSPSSSHPVPLIKVPDSQADTVKEDSPHVASEQKLPLSKEMILFWIQSYGSPCI